jgi:7,8-dihydropterin-6-yl-methyl-4-(beta-D-ribofuranosyl)aminobenzene 5'-phosphate synthase
MPPGAVDRIRITTVVDNYIDSLRQDNAVARRYSAFVAGKMPDLRAEHGLAHLVEITRGADRFTVALDFGLTPETMNHNFRELALDPASIDALALSHGHRDHWGGLTGFLHAWRRRLRRELPFYGGVDHFRPRWQQRGERRVYSGRLSRGELERYELAVTLVTKPTELAEGVWLSGEMHATEAWETIPSNLRVEEDGGALVQDTFIGEQTLVTNVRDRGLVVVTSCSHRGIVGICRNVVRFTGVPRVHAVIGGFHLSGLEDARITQVVDAFRGLDIEHVVPQHCTGIEAICAVAQRLPRRFTPSSVGTTFEFAAPNSER